LHACRSTLEDPTVKIVNQNGKTVQSGAWTVLVASKPAAE